MTEEQKKQFREKSKELVKWLCENGHPHMTIIVTPTSAELVEGTAALHTKEFVKD